MPETAQVIVVASQKGGSGKTTLSGHLAVEAERRGAGPVALIDTDPQGSLAKWWNARASGTPVFAEVSVLELGRDIDALKSAGVRLIVIDTPPALTSSIAEVVTFADLVVIPSRPSPHDLRAMGPTVDIVEHQHKPLVFVVNAATARARITGETAIALSQHGTVAPVTLHQRVDFAASMIDGRTVGEVNPDSRSAAEIAALWDYLADRLLRLRAASETILTPARPTFVDEVLTPARREMSADDFNDDGAPAPVIAPVLPTPGPVSAIDRRAASAAADIPQVSMSPTGGWDGVDRRKRDVGPPSGLGERRAFGLRNVAAERAPYRQAGMKP
jgi:chromosome partitioning protein